jgi:hypothetical protein
MPRPHQQPGEHDDTVQVQDMMSLLPPDAEEETGRYVDPLPGQSEA